MRRILREPITHFLIAGVAVFLLYGLLGRSDERRVVLSTQMRAALLQDFARRHGRAPSAEEGEGLVRRWVEDEILVREARLLGLDRGDPIVRRRLVQAMRFFIEDSAGTSEPSAAQLADWLASHAEDYRRPARRAGEQIFFSHQRGQPEAVAAAERALASGELVAGTIGDPFIHGSVIQLADEAQVERIYGRPFAQQLFTLAGDHWQGPIRSSFGAHLVRVTQRQPAQLPQLSEVEQRVRREWRAEQRRRITEGRLAALSERYAVVGTEPGR